MARLDLPTPVLIVISAFVSGAITSLLTHFFPPKPSTLAPIGPSFHKQLYERVDWWAQAGIGGIETVVGVWVWKAVKGRTDAAGVGAVVGLVARAPVVAYLHHHFLLPLPTLLQQSFQYLVAPFISLSLLPFLSSRSPRFLPSHHRLSTLLSHPPTFDQSLTYIVAVALASVVGALLGFGFERGGGKDWVEARATWRSVPVKLADEAMAELAPSYVMGHPTLELPSLRHTAPLPMPIHLLTSFLTLVLPSLFLPSSASSASFSPTLATFFLVFITTILTTGATNPVLKWEAAAVVAAELALRAAVGHAIVRWATLDVRRERRLAIEKASEGQSADLQAIEGKGKAKEKKVE